MWWLTGFAALYERHEDRHGMREDAYDCAKANVLVNLSWALHRREAMRFIRN